MRFYMFQLSITVMNYLTQATEEERKFIYFTTLEI